MSIKLKALGLALLAALAVGAVGVVSATAETGGHFTSDSSWTVVKGTVIEEEEGVVENELIDHDLEDAITCETTTHTGSIAGTTATSATAIPHFTGCDTTNGYPMAVDMNGCDFLLTVESSGDHTAIHLVCPGANQVKVTINPPIVGECHIQFPPQTPTSGGLTYTTGTVSGKHDLRVDATMAGITNTKTEIGFLGCAGNGGESNNSTLSGTVTAEGTDTAGNPVNITATGP